MKENHLHGEVGWSCTLPQYPYCTWTDVACSHNRVIVCSNASDNLQGIRTEAGLYSVLSGRGIEKVNGQHRVQTCLGVEEKADSDHKFELRVLHVNPLSVASNKKGNFTFSTTLPGLYQLEHTYCEPRCWIQARM